MPPVQKRPRVQVHVEPSKAGAPPRGKRFAARQPEQEADEDRARRRMEAMDDSGSDSAEVDDDGANGGGLAGLGGPDSADESEEESEGEGDVDEGEEGSEGSSGTEGPEETGAAAPLSWRASLADVAFEDIEKLRRDGGRVQPLAKRSAQPDGGPPGKAPHRANKNRPSEVTSKKPVGRLRLAHGFDAGALREASSRRIDPRFEPLAGKLDEAAVRQRYAHVYEQAEAEAAQMRRQLKEHRAAEAKPAAKRRLARKAGKLLSPEAALELRRQADQRGSFLSAQARAERERKAKAELRSKELALVSAGKRPFFAKKAQLKEAVLVRQYDELRQAGKLGTAIAERRKRRASKQRKWMPTARLERE